MFGYSKYISHHVFKNVWEQLYSLLFLCVHISHISGVF